MVEVNNKAIRDMMIDLYPNEVSQKSGSQEIEINNELNENKRALNSPNIIENMKKTRISINSDNFVHPVLKRDKEQTSKNTKKWMFSLLISIFSVFLFSSFFLSFIDNVCMRQELYLFDANGTPKPILLIILFVILLCFSRISFEFV